jgi:8-oxo-dGTP pyrophosphatase MutT (NUDIX family)
MHDNCCIHAFCTHIRHFRYHKNLNIGGVGVVIMNNYYRREWVILLGKEVSGRYAGKYNICSGNLDNSDNGCYINAAKRELYEEFKIDAFNDKTFDKIFKDSQNQIRFILHHDTPILVGIVVGLSRSILNNTIQNHMKDFSLSY